MSRSRTVTPVKKLTAHFQIRPSALSDLTAIDSLYPQAFPDEDLLPLVKDLIEAADLSISLVAVVDAQIAGHVVFTKCGVDGSSTGVALLGPLAVAPSWQRQGLGTALVQAGVEQMNNANVSLVLVLGDPAYYGRFGFRTERYVEPPYPLPANWSDAWQSLRLNDGGFSSSVKLAVPRPWLNPQLWA